MKGRAIKICVSHCLQGDGTDNILAILKILHLYIAFVNNQMNDYDC